jgi:hypothetical protein
MSPRHNSVIPSHKTGFDLAKQIDQRFFNQLNMKKQRID